MATARHVGMVLGMVAGILAASASALAGTPWRFIAVGDSRGPDNGINAPFLTEIAGRIVAEQPELVLFPGDLVEGSEDTGELIGQLTNWRDTMQPVYTAGIAVYAVRGNHEDQGSVEAWNTVFAGPCAMPGDGPPDEINVTYSLEHKNALIAGLDEYSGHTHRVNQVWLDERLAVNTRPHVFAFGHEPAFKAAHEDCLDSYPSDRDAFWASIGQAGGRVYLCGHDHFYDHARIDDQDGNPDNDLHQCIIGTAGAPLVVFDGIYDGSNSGMIPRQQYYASTYGYVVVDIDGLNVTLTWMQRVDVDDYVAMETWSYTALPGPGDLNADGYVDAADLGVFGGCMAGPGNPPPGDCGGADLNGSGGVDLLDAAMLQRLL